MMTNQNVVVQETMGLTVSSVANPTPIFRYPPPNADGSGFPIRRKCLPQLEIGTKADRINICLESMKASSPTHAKAAAILSGTPSETVSTWMMRHPSALSMFGEIMRASIEKQIVMFLDYDGTLSPIVDDPDRAFMSDAMRAAVRDVARYFPTAIVSGRCRDKVYNFVRLAELCYAGSHGMDIKVPAKGPIFMKANGNAVLCQPASKYLPMIDKVAFPLLVAVFTFIKCTAPVINALPSSVFFTHNFLKVYRALLEATKSTPGATVENNKFCLSVHFRCVNKKRWSALADQVKSVLDAYPTLKLTIGRKVLEIRPAISWDKGKALVFLLEYLGFANCKDVFPVYIGDDRTDEDAFKVLRDRGQGFGILVSKMPKETDASYSLQEPSEVMDFLQRLVEWKRYSLKPCPKV